MELEACSCDPGGPYAEFFVEKIVKARKSQVCCECGEQIQPGQQYQRITGMWEGEIRSYKTCLPCSRIRADYAPCACYTMLDEDISDVLGVRLNGDLMRWAEED